MNRADKISQMFYARRDEKRQSLVGKDNPKTKEIGLWKSLPANKRIRKDKVGK